jgi:Ca2+-binding RTX toxin-like protein
MDADGDAVVAYAVDDGDDGGLFFNRISKTGEVAPTIKVAAGEDMSVFAPSVAMNNAGEFYLGWIANVGPSDYRAIVHAYDARGASRGPEYEVGHTVGLVDSGKFGSIDLIVQPNSSAAGFALSLEEVSEDGATRHRIFHGLLSPTGKVGSNLEIDRFGGDEHSPTMSHGRLGTFVVGYVGRAAPTDTRSVLWAQTVSPTQPRILGGPMDLHRSASGEQIRSPQVALMPIAFVFATVFTQADSDLDTIYGNQYSNSRLGDPITIDAEPSFKGAALNDGKFNPAFDLDAFGNGAIAYVERSTSSVRVRRLGSTPAELRGAELFVSGTERDDHVIVEQVRANLFVNINGFVQRFNAAEVQFLSISGLGGDDDIINASAIPSTISGGNGEDTLWGGTGSDDLRGFRDGDVLRGGDGADLLQGGDDYDTLHGGYGNDSLRGGSGEDRLTGGPGKDHHQGDSGNDWLDGDAPGGSDTFIGGTDIDTLDYSSRSNPVTIDLQTDGADGEAGDGDFAYDDLEILIGGSGNDLIGPLGALSGFTVFGGAGDDTIRGGSSDDVLIGETGDDEIRALDGNDTLDGGSGNDSLFGEAGNDSLAGSGGDDYFEGGAGDDLIDGGTGTDALFGLGGNDRLFADDGAADTVRGGPGDDSAGIDDEDDVLAVETVS